MTRALANVEHYLCTDAFPTSTFISGYYLNFRGVADRAGVVPLDQIDATLNNLRIDLALNIHSFSECRPAAIDWWVSRLAAAKVRHLLVVPNAGADHDGSILKTNDGAISVPSFGSTGIAESLSSRSTGTRWCSATPSTPPTIISSNSSDAGPRASHPL
jgi:hypothetical protein